MGQILEASIRRSHLPRGLNLAPASRADTPRERGPMSGHRVATVLVALVLAGCGAADPSSSASPDASVADLSTAPVATTLPSPTRSSLAPMATAVCPSGPLTVEAFLSADSSCYAVEQVAVVGWWGARRADEPGETTPFSWVLRGSMPFGAESETSEDILFVDETAVAPPAGEPDGIHWAAVTGRRSASSDQRACHRDLGADLFAAPHCPPYLIATGVVESEPPPSALAGCSKLTTSDGGWVSVGDFTTYARPARARTR